MPTNYRLQKVSDTSYNIVMTDSDGVTSYDSVVDSAADLMLGAAKVAYWRLKEGEARRTETRRLADLYKQFRRMQIDGKWDQKIYDNLVEGMLSHADELLLKD